MILIPQPKKAERRDGEFTIGYGSYLVLEESCGPLLTKQAMLFLDALEEETGYRPALTRGKGRDGDIILRREDALGPEDVLGPEDILWKSGRKGSFSPAVRKGCGMECRRSCRWQGSRAPYFRQ